MANPAPVFALWVNEVLFVDVYALGSLELLGSRPFRSLLVFFCECVRIVETVALSVVHLPAHNHRVCETHRSPIRFRRLTAHLEIRFGVDDGLFDAEVPLAAPNLTRALLVIDLLILCQRLIA